MEVTTATCCPRGYTVPEGFVGATSLAVPVYCESVIGNGTSVYDIDKSTWTAISSGVVRAEGIEVRWREGDFDPPGSGLSTAAKAGIGVGAGLGTVALGMAAGAYWFLRRRRKRTEESRDRGAEDSVGLAKEIDNSGQAGPVEVPGQDLRPELEGQETMLRQELPAEERAGELDADETRKTMDGGDGRCIAELEG